MFPATNDDLVEELRRAGANIEVLAAFAAVDRGSFCVSHGASIRGCYADMPYRDDIVHLSAPSIYAESLEALLPLSDESSVLVIGSGSGYFCSLVSAITLGTCEIIGVELVEELVEFSRQRVPKNVSIVHGNAFDIQPHLSSRFDRVYVAGGTDSKGHRFFRFLKVDGKLVGPFESSEDSQDLVSVVRNSPEEFTLKKLKSVMFAHLVEPEREDKPLVLPIRTWSVATHRGFPKTFRVGVEEVLKAFFRIGRMKSTISLSGSFLAEQLFPWLRRDWFRKEEEFHEPEKIYEIDFKDTSVAIETTEFSEDEDWRVVSGEEIEIVEESDEEASFGSSSVPTRRLLEEPPITHRPLTQRPRIVVLRPEALAALIGDLDAVHGEE